MYVDFLYFFCHSHNICSYYPQEASTNVKKVSWFKLDMFTISDWRIHFDLRLTLNGVSHHSSILFLNHSVPRKEGNSMNFYYFLFSWWYSVQRQTNAVPIIWADCIICLQKLQAEILSAAREKQLSHSTDLFSIPWMEMFGGWKKYRSLHCYEETHW